MPSSLIRFAFSRLASARFSIPAFAALSVLLVSLALALAGAAPAPSHASADGPAIETAEADLFKSLIDKQIAAFRADDAAAAYAFASPAIQRKFVDAETFMALVKAKYAAVHRPRSYSFGGARRSHVGPIQEVNLIGPDGGAWRAIYAFERQRDGSWRISGCFLSKVGIEA